MQGLFCRGTQQLPYMWGPGRLHYESFKRHKTTYRRNTSSAQPLLSGAVVMARHTFWSLCFCSQLKCLQISQKTGFGAQWDCHSTCTSCLTVVSHLSHGSHQGSYPIIAVLVHIWPQCGWKEHRRTQARQLPGSQVAHVTASHKNES